MTGDKKPANNEKTMTSVDEEELIDVERPADVEEPIVICYI